MHGYLRHPVNLINNFLPYDLNLRKDLIEEIEFIAEI